jgi:hypothetical protein
MRPRQKRNFEGSGAIDRRKLAAVILAWPEFGAATFVNAGRLYGWSDLLSSRQAHT